MEYPIEIMAVSIVSETFWLDVILLAVWAINHSSFTLISRSWNVSHKFEWMKSGLSSQGPKIMLYSNFRVKCLPDSICFIFVDNFYTFLLSESLRLIDSYSWPMLKMPFFVCMEHTGGAYVYNGGMFGNGDSIEQMLTCIVTTWKYRTRPRQLGPW